MKVWFTSAANWELSEAANYYEEQQQGLGARFLAEVEATVARIAKNPELWGSISPRGRSHSLRWSPSSSLA